MSINPKAKLVEHILDLRAIEQVPTRKGYGEGLLEAGEKDPRVVALCADLTESTQTHLFAKKFPERFIEMGVAEQNMATVAAGLASYGKIPFITSYAMFSPGRNWEQIRTTICYNNVPVKVIGSHAGISVGPDGATHQAIEDMAITRVIPNMTVINPCDVHEARKATLAALEVGPVYIRLHREKTPVMTTPESPFEIGKAVTVWDSDSNRVDASIVACGPLVYNAILAASELEKEGYKIRVLNSHTVKPLDEEDVLKAAKDSGAIVTVEEHQITGGLGSAVAEYLAKNYPVPMEFVGVENRFGESGAPNELLKAFGMESADIKKAILKVISRKK